MEQLKKLDYDSDIIICEDIPDTISVSTSPENVRKSKKKKHRRKVKRAVNFNNNMETLLITQKLKVKKTKFKCVININTVCNKRSDSIVRFHTNVCKQEAYYHRIAPICLREKCSLDSSCCRSTMSRDNNKYINSKVGSLSPVSSIALTEVLPCSNISYEDVTNGSFSSPSEDELDTLIRRTRQREKQYYNSNSAQKYITSTPIFSGGVASPFSLDMDKKSIHSDNTMILNPLPIEAYSPNSLDVFTIESLESIVDTNEIIDIDAPYSPTMTPDLIKIDNLDYSPDRNSQDDDLPYSPTYTPETIEVDIMDYGNKRNPTNLGMNQPYSPTSPTFTPDIIEMDILGNASTDYGNEPYSPTATPDMIKVESPINSIEKANPNETVNVGSQTVTPDFHKLSITKSGASNNHNVPYSSSESGIIKQENLDESILSPDLMKNENEITEEDNGNAIDYYMNNTIHCKSHKSEKDDHRRSMHDQVNLSEINVKIEKDNFTSVDYVYSTILTNNENIKTDRKHS